jgi:hypothetical protein
MYIVKLAVQNILPKCTDVMVSSRGNSITKSMTSFKFC